MDFLVILIVVAITIIAFITVFTIVKIKHKNGKYSDVEILELNNTKKEDLLNISKLLTTLQKIENEDNHKYDFGIVEYKKND